MIEPNRIYNEPCLTTLSRMDDNSVDCVITSPPYWQLRDYGYSGQWGLEPTFQEYLEHLWQLMDEVYRVLKPTGTAWVNLGDTYGTKSGNFTGGNTIENKIKYVGSIENYNKPSDLHKCLILIPHRFAIGCIDRGWIVRNDVIWAKRNGMPESCTDRFSKKHEYFFFMVKSQKYFFDLDAVRNKYVDDYSVRVRNKGSENWAKQTNGPSEGDRNWWSKGGSNPGSVSDFWDIPTKPSSEKHYASYNDSLLVKPVLAGCPEFVCCKCGKPREKIINREFIGEYNLKEAQLQQEKCAVIRGGTEKVTLGRTNNVTRQEVGLTDCGCGAGFQGGVIYDPFMGTGSTAEVAIRSKRQFIGSEMSKDYCEIAEKRLEPFLTQPMLL